MRRFLLKTAAALLIILALHAVAGQFADGCFDAYYLRFTGERQGSLILGTSRAAQGLRPAVMAMERGGHRSDVPFNFAFTIGHSPYGPTYLHAVRAKLDTTEHDGTFIVTVDPWSLCDDIQADIGPGTMPEDRLQLGEQWTFNGDPNYEYLVRNTTAGWGSFIGGPLHHLDTMMVLHRDGWLQVRVRLDSAAVAERMAKKVEHYRKEMLPTHRPGTTRMQYLEELLELLGAHGQPFLVRLPVCDAMVRIEEELWPGFDATLASIAVKHGLPYWNLMPDRNRYTYTDGNHLDTTSARVLSAELARRIAATDNSGR